MNTHDIKKLETMDPRNLEHTRIRELSSSLEQNIQKRAECLDSKDADVRIESRLISKEKSAEQSTRHQEISFGSYDSPERAKRYYDIAYKYMNEYRRYEREANKLDELIKRKREPESRKSEVSRLHDKAKKAKMEADRYNRYGKMELNRG